MRNQYDTKIREHILDYVIHLLEDAQDFSWSAAKASHAVLLCRKEQGEISGWSDFDKIDRIRCAHAQRHVTAPLIKVKKLNKSLNNQVKFSHVYTLTRTHACKRVHMKQEEYFIGTYVRYVFRLRAKHTHIHMQIVVSQSQKTSNSGWRNTDGMPIHLELYIVDILIIMPYKDFRVLIKMPFTTNFIKHWLLQLSRQQILCTGFAVW